MAVNTAAACALLHARYDEILGQLAGMPAAGSASENGRSLSTSAAELKAQLDLVTQQAAMLGCPVGTVGQPAAVYHRARA